MEILALIKKLIDNINGILDKAKEDRCFHYIQAEVKKSE